MTQALLVVGLGYGDEGKGTIVDFLVRRFQVKTVVRYNGGPQAGHHVVEISGRTHCFSQFASGTLVPGVRTHISRQVPVKLISLLKESEVLAYIGVKDALARLSVDPKCCLVTSLHALIGQLLELSSGSKRHGSVGMGVGQAALEWELKGKEALILGDIYDPDLFKEKLSLHWYERWQQAEQILAENPSSEAEETFDFFRGRLCFKELATTYLGIGNQVLGGSKTDRQILGAFSSEDGTIVLEGAQGTLLDREYGFYPYTTRLRTSLGEADSWLDGADFHTVTIGTLRAYMTRHGPGPFVTEDINFASRVPDMHNKAGEWNGPFRIGWLDVVALRYSIRQNMCLDFLALTNLDRLSGLPAVYVCDAYEYSGVERDLLDKYFIWEQCGSRVKILEIKARIVNPEEEKGELARLLFDCKPWKYRKFPGWNEDISQVREVKRLPKKARDYLSYLASSEGLGVPIGIVSVGPTAGQKIELFPIG